MKPDYEKTFKDGMKVTVENGWTIIYGAEGNEITRSLTKYFFNNSHGYNCLSYDDMSNKIHEFWR
jgi:hypothetical protein